MVSPSVSFCFGSRESRTGRYTSGGSCTGGFAVFAFGACFMNGGGGVRGETLNRTCWEHIYGRTRRSVVVTKWGG